MLTSHIEGRAMTPTEVIKHYDDVMNFQRLTKMSRNSLNNWIAWGYVPFVSQKKLECISRGALRAVWDDKEIPGKYKTKMYGTTERQIAKKTAELEALTA